MSIDKNFTPPKLNARAGFSDPSGINPLAGYHFKSTLNKEVVGEEKITIEVGGGDPAISDLAAFNITSLDEKPAEYGSVQVQETKSGHKMVFDDTPDAERVVIAHGKGAGLELKSDGSINIRSKNNIIISVDAHGAIIIDGDLRVSSKNLSIDATGDLDLNVSGDYNLKVAGDRKETIYGSDRKEVTGNQGEIIKGNKSSTSLGSETNTVFGSYTNIVKGSISNTAEGDVGIAAKGAMKVSSQTEYNAAAPSVNISAGDMSILSSSGTIGGESVIMYNYNMYTQKNIESTTMNATTFFGDLKGTAETAIDANTSAAPGSGGASGTFNTPVDGKASFMPGVALMKQILSFSTKGISEVQIDDGDYIRNKIDRTTAMGGVANRALTPEEVRAKFKEDAHRDNDEFLGAITKDGSVSNTFRNGTPPGVGRTSSGRGSVSYVPSGTHNTTVGNGSNKHISSEPKSFGGFKPNERYNPMAIDPREGVNAINSKTLLAEGIPLSTFMGGKGGASNLGHFGTLEERQEVARYLHLQTECFKLITNAEILSKHRLIVAEGIYKPLPSENVSDTSLLGLHKKGRAITYEIYDNSNTQHPEITFELAEYFVEYLTGYDKIVLNYDTLDPRKEEKYVHGQVTVVLPEIDYKYELVGKKQPDFGVETRFNGKILSDTDLIEVDKDGNVVEPEPYVETGQNGRLDESNLASIGGRHKMIKPAAEAYLKMVAAAEKDGITWSITDSYRTYAGQVDVADRKGIYGRPFKGGIGLAAVPGTSKHGWGKAVDLGGGVNVEGSPQNNWLDRNASRFNFKTIPREPWHWQWEG